MWQNMNQMLPNMTQLRWRIRSDHCTWCFSLVCSGFRLEYSPLQMETPSPCWVSIAQLYTTCLSHCVYRLPTGWDVPGVNGHLSRRAPIVLRGKKNLKHPDTALNCCCPPGTMNRRHWTVPFREAFRPRGLASDSFTLMRKGENGVLSD